MRPLRVIAFGGHEDRSARSYGSQRCDIVQIDMSGCRSAKEDHVELFAALDQASELGSRDRVRNPPAPRLLSKGQFEAVATQSALVDDREMAANRERVSGRYAGRERCLALSELIEDGQVVLREITLCMRRLRENDAINYANRVIFCNPP